ncbi:lipoyl protein ligase domain-containing protein [Halorubrum trueperi]|uniref:Lipoate--protein ligase family protein n=1 Tax=Halorubrum trueperi TaxID=2004704 RepID=A0ABD5UMT8_9EURY
MRVVRGPASDPASDRERTAELLAAAADGTPGIRTWTPPRQVAFGRRDAGEDGFERAKSLATERGYRPVERDVGGRAVAYPGNTIAFAHAIPLDDNFGGDDIDRDGEGVDCAGEGVDRGVGDAERGVDGRSAPGSIEGRYERATVAVVDALEALGADVARGEPPGSFCPGNHSIRVAGGGKLSGIAQRVRSDVALVAGCLVVTRADASEFAAVTESVYGALGVPFDPSTVGCVADAGGPTDPKRVARAIENAFVTGPWGDGDRRVVRIGADD